MSLNKITTKKVVSCGPTSSIRQVTQLMKEEVVGSVLILQDGRPVGIITDRDIALRCSAEGLDCNTTQVCRLMTRPVETLDTEDGIYDVVELMKSRKIRRVPIVDKTGLAVGLVSSGDVFGLLNQELADMCSATAPERSKLFNRAA